MRPFTPTIPLLLLALAGSASSNAQDISGDMGGFVVDYAVRALNAPAPRITGRCYSACTLYLGNPNVCATKYAVLAFHAPYGADKRGNKFALAFMMMKYPPGIKAWIESHGGLTSKKLYLRAPEIFKYVRRCT